MKRLFFTFVALLSFVVSNAQIGYQVALLNTATGEPRSNETVTCEVKLTNCEGGIVYEGTSQATSNDFGVVSLTVGDANTFNGMDWSKLPLSISVSVEGRLVGQTEVLTVPVAEHAKHYGTLTYENIGEKEVVCNEYGDNDYKVYWSFSFNGHNVSATYHRYNRLTTYAGTFYIRGDAVFGEIEQTTDKTIFIGHYSPEDDKIYIIVRQSPDIDR